MRAGDEGGYNRLSSRESKVLAERMLPSWRQGLSLQRRTIVPPTLLATVGYWLVGKPLRTDSALVPLRHHRRSDRRLGEHHALAPLADQFAIKLSLHATGAEPAPMWGMAAVGCLTMFVLGVERLRERRTWLTRVRQGKVPGWLVLSPDQVGESTGELPVFCARLAG